MHVPPGNLLSLAVFCYRVTIFLNQDVKRNVLVDITCKGAVKGNVLLARMVRCSGAM